MERKQRFFIYERKEMGVLLLLGLMVAVFAFTLGVHLGKRVAPQTLGHGPADAEAVPTMPDKLPNRQELTEQAKGAQQAADDSLNQALHDEVARTGIKMDSPRQLELPEKPIAKNGGATTGSPAVEEATPEHNEVVAPRAEPHAPAHESRSETHSEASAEKVQPLENDAVALHRPSPSGRFTLQIGSYPALDEARDQADALEALGLKPFMRRAQVQGKQWFRIYVGGFNTKDAAEKTGARYVSQHMIEAYVISKRVD